MSRPRWIAVALWVAFIEVLTSWPSPPTFGVPEGSDKVVHLVLYAVLGFLVARAIRAGRPTLAVSLVAFVAVAGWAALDEWHQRLLATRTASVADWVADVAGVAIGLAARHMKPAAVSAGAA